MTCSRRLCALPGAILIAGQMLCAHAMAEEPPGWHGYADEGMASLFWGVPQSDDAEISFSCQAGEDMASFAFAFAPIHAVDGVEVTVTLEAGDIIVPIKTNGALMPMDDQFVLEGQVAVDARFIDLVTSRGILSVFVEDGSAEYELDGAREAAANLIATCGQEAAPAARTSCAFDAWIEADGPNAQVLREGPSAEAAALAKMPGPYPGYDGEAYPTATITGAENGWFRVSRIVNYLYAERDPETVFAGEGWVEGKALRLYVESSTLLDRPAGDAAIAAEIGDEGDNFFYVDRLYACDGGWVEVGGTYGTSRVRGWSNDTCESQITTCP